MIKLILISLATLVSFSAFSQWNETQSGKLTTTDSVGIGTTNPESKLHVQTNNIGIKTQYSLGIFEGVDAQIDLISSSAGNWGSSLNLIEGNGGSNTDIWSIVRRTSSGGSNLRFNYGTINNHTNSNILTLTNDGKVGIGTSNPTHPLTINGGSFSDGGKSIVLERQLSGGVYNDIKASLGISGNTSQGGLRFLMSADDGNTWNDVLFLQAGGNIGVGTPNPDSKLAVNGTIHTKEVKIDLIGWSDFVFEKDYKLQTLEEVEQHINKNGHLPEIPSEVEVTENGINLGEMNAKLLQKIEELTLYLIEQNKRMNQLEDKNAELEKEISTLKNK